MDALHLAVVIGSTGTGRRGPAATVLGALRTLR